MNLSVRSLRAAAILFALPVIALATAVLPAAQSDPSATAIDEIVRKFAEKESQFKLARANYTYRQDVRIQELDPRGNVQFDEKGNLFEYHAVTEILFDNKARRIEKKVGAPFNGLSRYVLTGEDFEDLRDIQPFVLTTEDLPRYTLRYTGREHVDEIRCYVFEVGPKRMEKGQRYFQGTVWVDETALQIIKTYGKAVPDLNEGKPDANLFPRFETYREQIDGKFWFPTRTIANDTLNFSGRVGGPIRVRYLIRYENYRQFVSDVKIIPNGARN